MCPPVQCWPRFPIDVSRTGPQRRHLSITLAIVLNARGSSLGQLHCSHHGYVLVSICMSVSRSPSSAIGLMTRFPFPRYSMRMPSPALGIQPLRLPPLHCRATSSTTAPGSSGTVEAMPSAHERTRPTAPPWRPWLLLLPLLQIPTSVAPLGLTPRSPHPRPSLHPSLPLRIPTISNCYATAFTQSSSSRGSMV